MARLSQATRDAVRDGAKRSAAVVWPLLVETLGPPASVLDVGTGEGHWLDAADQLGPAHSLGVDLMPLGEATTSETRTGAPIEHWNAEHGTPLPTLFEASGLQQRRAGDRWALALCLEMAEHVTPAAGEHLVRELTRVADVVVWSAAIPGQGGDGHVNEQPPGYWAERFARFGWVLTDPFREYLWDDPRVEPWYAQNLLLATPRAAPGEVRPIPRYLIHPTVWRHHRGLA